MTRSVGQFVTAADVADDLAQVRLGLEQGAADQVDIKFHLNGEWPSQEELSAADTVVIYSDGGGGSSMAAGISTRIIQWFSALTLNRRGGKGGAFRSSY